jgi:hypothetical protein
MTGLPYVLIVLFAMSDGSVATMRTSQGFASPLACSMRAFQENDGVRDRTYVCVGAEHAARLAATRRVAVSAPAR